MKFKNRRLDNIEEYETLQEKVAKQNRQIVNHTLTTDEGLGVDRTEVPFVWDPSIASMTYTNDGAVVLCKIIADDSVKTDAPSPYPEPKVFDVKGKLGEHQN